MSDLSSQDVRGTVGALSGVNWRLASSSLRFVGQFVVAAILAHILLPKDLGLLALAVIVAAFATTIAELGIGPALVQHSNLTSTHIRVGFTLSFIVGISAAAIVWAVAPTAAVLFGNAEVIPVLRFLALCPLFESLGIASRSLLLRNLDFKRQFWADTCANLVGYAAVSIGLALLGYGVWGPAVGVVARSLATSTALFLMAPIPGGLLLSRREASEILHFGLGESLTRLANYGAGNADYIVVGTWLGAEALGLYQYAYQLAYFPITFVTAELSFVLFPTLAAIRGKPERFQSVYRGALVLVSLITLPSAVAIAISAPDLVPVVFGDRWVNSVIPLQILCVGAVFRALYNLSDSLARAAGAVYQKAARHLVYAVAVLGCSMMGLTWGLVGVSTGVVVAILLISSMMIQLSISLVQGNWVQFLKTQLYPGLVALAVGAGGAAGSGLGQIVELSPAGRLALVLLGCAMGALVGTGAMFMSRLRADTAGVLIDAVDLIPYERIRTWLLQQLQGGQAVDWSRTTKDLVRHIPGLVRACRESRILWYALREGLWRACLSSQRKDRPSPWQRVLTWDVSMPPAPSSRELVNWLAQEGLTIHMGGHTVYLPPQERLRAVLGKWVDLYPPDAGVKILMDYRPPEQAYYVWHEDSGVIARHLTGTPADQLLTANFLYANNVCPRVYDLCCLRSGSIRFSAFIVQHVIGRAPSEKEYWEFLARLTELVDKTELRTTRPVNRTVDFEPPTCNGNLLVARGSGDLRYIDFQTFRLRNPSMWRQDIMNTGIEVLHFGDEHALCGGRYLYQSVPGLTEKGKRNVSRRWTVIREHLDRNGLDVDRRLILDVGCNAGMMTAQALHDGALWGVGWDLPAVVTYAEPFLLSLGLTRFSLIAADLNRTYPLHEDIPHHLRPYLSESILFFLSVRQHIGLMDSLSQLPWRVLIYEGHERERLEDLEDYLGPLLQENIRILSQAYLGDGFSGRRPLAILVRR